MREIESGEEGSLYTRGDDGVGCNRTITTRRKGVDARAKGPQTLCSASALLVGVTTLPSLPRPSNVS